MLVKVLEIQTIKSGEFYKIYTLCKCELVQYISINTNQYKTRFAFYFAWSHKPGNIIIHKVDKDIMIDYMLIDVHRFYMDFKP